MKTYFHHYSTNLVKTFVQILSKYKHISLYISTGFYWNEN